MTNDFRFLRTAQRHNFESGPNPIRCVDLFSGCGGLTLGLAEAARTVGRGLEVALAVDSDEAIGAVFHTNFPKARLEVRGVEEIFDGELGESPTDTETEWRERIAGDDAQIHVLHGGPPCQGHSDLNNHTRRNDPRNRFYERMARAAEILTPPVVVIENVPPVRNDRGRVVDRASRALEQAGYAVADRVISFAELGVPQRRRRHTVLAAKDISIDPTDCLDGLGGRTETDLRWAIADLVGAQLSPLDVPARVSPANKARINWLFDKNAYDLDNNERPQCHRGDHSYVSMYGRLRWDQPAQTITSGYGSMGQGRYVHPSERRTLTPHEAARLQFLPDWFDFTAGGREMRRGLWATMIGNAVPPKLMMEVGRILLPHLS